MLKVGVVVEVVCDVARIYLRLSKTGYKGDLAGNFLFSARSCASRAKI